jgi:hypothetical protein
MQKFNISFFLIHNNDNERIANSTKLINSLMSELNSFNLNCIFRSVSFQPEILNCSKLISNIRLFIYFYLEITWSKYRKLGNKFSLWWNFYNFITIYNKLVLFNRNLSWQKKSAIEIYLTAKHIRSWEFFVESDSNLLIICEDDVVLKELSTKRFCDLINRIESFDQPLYIDIAGGLSIDSLRVNNLILNSTIEKIIFSKPVTNTTCCYLVNKSFIRLALKVIIDRPYLRYIGADWLINTIFIILARDNTEIYCEHYNPPILSHGTFTGSYKSSINS